MTKAEIRKELEEVIAIITLARTKKMFMDLDHAYAFLEAYQEDLEDILEQV